VLDRFKIWAFPAILAVALGLRLWGLVFGSPAEHPDEIFLVVYPLNFFSGDLNPHSFHKPTFHFYLLGLVYAVYFIVGKMFGRDWTGSEFAAYHTFFDTETLLLLARLTSVVFSTLTIWWVYRLARRVGGNGAAIAAAALLAVSTLHVRQTPLAAVDVPLAFWVVVATMAAVRLLETDRTRDYLMAGALVGLAASTKYPGAAVGLAIPVAHLCARRSILQPRLWAAPLAAVALFLATSPYVLLDFVTFKAHFLFQASHAQAGRGGGDLAWWHHLSFSLRHSLGYLGLVAGSIVVCLQIFRHRQLEVWVVLAAFTGIGLAVGWAQLTFVRYALPLAVLQVILVALALKEIPSVRWRTVLFLALLIEPLYGSVRVAQLQASEDTRHAARRWMERNATPAARCCNFGGWAGSVPVETVEHLWWKRQKALRNLDAAAVDALLSFLERENPHKPFFSYVIQYGNRELHAGSIETVEDFECEYVILHDHPLSGTGTGTGTGTGADTSLVRALADVGTRVAVFAPEGLADSRPEFDPIDAYYIPLANFGALRQSGPAVQIWRTGAPHTPSRPQSATLLLAAASGRAAKSALDEGRPDEFNRLVRAAARRDPSFADARFYNEAGVAFRRVGRFGEAIRYWEQALAVDPAMADAHFNQGVVYRFDLNQPDRALASWQAALAIDPGHLLSHDHLGALYRSQGRPENAIQHWLRLTQLDPGDVDAHYNLGLTFAFDLHAPRAAIEHWRTALEIRPQHPETHYNMGVVLYGEGRYAKALTHWKAAVALDSTDARGYNSLGSAYKALADYDAAIRAWKRSTELDPTYVKAYFNMGLTYLNNLNQLEAARRSLRRVLELRPDHPRAQEIRQVLSLEP
jgi:tetratricopeptide (TPR) repeat protein